MKRELVMAQGGRDGMERECMQLVGGYKGGSNEKSKRWSYVNSRRVGKQTS